MICKTLLGKPFKTLKKGGAPNRMKYFEINIYLKLKSVKISTLK